MQQNERNKKLIDEIVSYTVGFNNAPEDKEEEETPEEHIKDIESYGVAITETGNDKLLKNAIRHLLYTVNMWHPNGEVEILKELGFTEAEIEKYYEHLYD